MVTLLSVTLPWGGTLTIAGPVPAPAPAPAPTTTPETTGARGELIGASQHAYEQLLMSPAGRSVAESLLLDGDVAEGGGSTQAAAWRVPSSTVREAVYEAGQRNERSGDIEAAHERYAK